jgi:hypothetical protein
LFDSIIDRFSDSRSKKQSIKSKRPSEGYTS